jgi:hypothetical protein
VVRFFGRIPRSATFAGLSSAGTTEEAGRLT